MIGATVMEGFYVVFDRTQRRLGFALSNCAGEDAHQAAVCPKSNRGFNGAGLY